MRIGRVVRIVEDTSRKEIFGKTDENRKVIISIFYPVDENYKIEKEAFYKDLYDPKQDEFINDFKCVVNKENEDEKEDFLNNLKINIYNDMPICREDKQYPVIIHCTGLGCSRDYMTFNTEALVENGYIVVTIEHLHDSMLSVFPDGTIIRCKDEEFTQEEKLQLIDIRSKDISFVIDELFHINDNDEMLKGKFNLDLIGISGHSLGGAATFKSCIVDSRIKAMILYDASLQFFDVESELKKRKRLKTPVLNFRREDFGYSESMKGFLDFAKKAFEPEKFKEQTLVYDKVLRDSEKNQNLLYKYLSGYKSFIKLKGATHMTFSDYYTLTGNKMENNNLSVEEAHKCINTVSVNFFDEFLLEKKGNYSELKEGKLDCITKVD